MSYRRELKYKYFYKVDNMLRKLTLLFLMSSSCLSYALELRVTNNTVIDFHRGALHINAESLDIKNALRVHKIKANTSGSYYYDPLLINESLIGEGALITVNCNSSFHAGSPYYRATKTFIWLSCGIHQIFGIHLTINGISPEDMQIEMFSEPWDDDGHIALKYN